MGRHSVWKPGDLRQLAETAAAKSSAGDGPLLYALVAALANDRKTAGALFKEIGTDLDSPYWSCTSSGYNGGLAFAAQDASWPGSKR